MNANEANPGLHELVERLTDGGFRFELAPVAGMVDGTTREFYYGISVVLDRMKSEQLEQLLAIVDGSPYEGSIHNGRLVLEQPR